MKLVKKFESKLELVKKVSRRDKEIEIIRESLRDKEAEISHLEYDNQKLKESAGGWSKIHSDYENLKVLLVRKDALIGDKSTIIQGQAEALKHLREDLEKANYEINSLRAVKSSLVEIILAMPKSMQ